MPKIPPMQTVAAQVKAFDQGALLRPVPELGTLIVTGDDRQTWLNGMLTADLKPLKPSQGTYALSVSKNGHLQADLWVALEPDRILLGLPADLCDSLRETLDHHLIMEDAEIQVAEEPLSWWLCYGPNSDSVAKIAREQGASVAMGRLGDSDTAIIVAPNPTPPDFSDALTAVEGTLLATPDGWERIAIERMLPRYGVDFEVGCYPQEAALEKLAVSFNKGCYVGQEAVFKLEKRGHVSKRLVRLVIEGEAGGIGAGDEIVDAGGEPVGTITSVTVVEGRTLALGVVVYRSSAEGAELSVGGHSAKVS